ncbi:MAG: hypothetical protein PHE52_02880, partial [Candidatus Pacebacteria bacterium]|nr:hypothetical protein [Candidatus Paceibacterota bacterium]
MQNSYLNISRTKDLDNPKERFIYRIFEFIPALVSWGTLFLAVIFSWLAPVWVAVFIIVFDIFWLLRIFYLSFHQSASYRLMKENLKIDWLERVKKLENWEKIHHLIILPMYKEGIEIVGSSIQSMLDANYPKEKMIIILATEARAGNEAQEVARLAKEEFGNKFFQFLVTAHPNDIPGEIAGKGSNVAWAAKEAKAVFDKLSMPYENIIASNFDIDTRPYPQYFAILTWKYLTSEKSLRA